MKSYQQIGDGERTCYICQKPIVNLEYYLDLFRHESAYSGHPLLWAHVTCAQTAIQTWILKKEQQRKIANE